VLAKTQIVQEQNSPKKNQDLGPAFFDGPPWASTENQKIFSDSQYVVIMYEELKTDLKKQCSNSVFKMSFLSRKNILIKHVN
jgi:hypothetical protein